MAKLNPYLNFNNKCREAMTFYKNCLGGELFFQTVDELPEMAAQMPPEMKESILHAMLTSGDIVIMASDHNREGGIEGNTIQLCINCDSEEQLHTFFDKLSQGGRIIQKPEHMPWGGKYAELQDRYRKYWLFNYQLS